MVQNRLQALSYWSKENLMNLTLRDRFCLFLLLTSFLALGLWRPAAASTPESFGGVQEAMTAGVSEHEGVRIDTIQIDNRNVFDLSDRRYNRFPFKTANKLHLVTRRSVIERELLFQVGDPFSQELAEETARNLRTRLALYDAWIDIVTLPDGRLLVRVVTVDQWSFILYARLTREANLTNIRFGFEERNLLGRNQLLSLEYFIADQEDNHIELSYRNSRFMKKSIRIDAAYNSDPVNEVRHIALTHPYYNLRQVLSWGLLGIQTRLRTDDPTNDRRVYTRSDELQLSLGGRWGSYHDKFLLSTEYQYRTAETYATSFLNRDSIITQPFDSTYHRLLLFTGFQSITYRGMKRINGFEYTEDIETGFTAIAGIGRAATRRLDTYLFDQLVLQLAAVKQLGNSVLSLSYDRTLWFPKEAPTITYTTMTGRFYQTSLKFATLAFRARYVKEERDATLYLGGQSGVRGYERDYAGGDRLFVSNAEVRLFPGIEILSVKFGGALFVDAGRAYEPAQSFDLKHLIVSAGGGLRISFERSARSELVRVDLAHTRVERDGRLKSVWELSIGSGQYF